MGIQKCKDTCPVPPSFSSQRESGQYHEYWWQSPGPLNPSQPLGFHIPWFYRDHAPATQCPHVSTPKDSLGPLSPDKQTHLGARRRGAWGQERGAGVRGSEYMRKALCLQQKHVEVKAMDSGR